MQSPRWTWLTLIACAAAAGSAGAQVAPEPAAEPEADGRGWRIPPILWSGSLAYDLRSHRGGGEGSSLAHLVTGTLGLKTYVYQPWLAVVAGNVGLTNSWSRDSRPAGSGPFGTDPSLHETIRGREQFLTGNASVNVFPQSRFPFEFHVDRADSRINSGLASTFDFRTTSWGFSQRYRPLTGRWNSTAGYEHREQSGAGFRATQDSLTGDFHTNWKHNDASLGASHSRARSQGLDDDSRFTTLVGRHSYVPSTDLSLNSTANWTRTQESAAAAQTDLDVLQFSSVGMMRRGPRLSLTGSARALLLREAFSGAAVDSGGLSLGANYEFSPQLRLTANGGVNATRSGDASSSVFTGSVGAAYQGDSREIAGARYDWFTSGTVGGAVNQGSDAPGERQASVSLQLGHTMSRSWRTGETSNLSLNGGQTLTWSDSRSSGRAEDPLAANDRSRGASTSLLNMVGLTWQSGGDGRTVYARTSYNDSIEFQSRDRFQLFNAQLSGNLEIDNRRSLNGDLTFQHTRQSTGLVLDGVAGGSATTTGASGEISYQHQRLLGVPRLRFVSRLKLAQDVLKQPGTLLTLPDRETRLWENRLDWSVGRLDAQVVLRFSRVDGRGRQSIMFRVQRSFGN